MASHQHAPRITIGDLTRAEVTKARTDPTIPRAFIGTLLANLALFGLSSAEIVRLSSGDRLVKLSEMGALMFAPVYLFLIIPVYAAGSEYASGQYRVTLAAVPNRNRLVVAKLAALAAVVIPAAVAVLLPGRLIISISDGLPAGYILLDLTRWTAAYVLMSCVAYGLAVLLRSRMSPLAILVLVPLLMATGVFPFPTLIRLLPDQLSLSLLGTPGFAVTALPVQIAAVLLTVWATALLVAQALAVLVRDS